jgi:hypothetical protein
VGLAGGVEVGQAVGRGVVFVHVRGYKESVWGTIV